MKPVLYLCSLAVALVGCGGAGDSISDSGANSDFGTLSATGFVSGAPVTANSTLVKFVGVTGSFTQVTIRDNMPTIDDTAIAVGSSTLKVYAIDPDGQNERVLVENSKAMLNSLVFSENASRLYYAGAYMAYAPIFGGSPVVLQQYEGTQYMDFSPDYTRIVTAETDGPGTNLYTQNLDGSGRQKITNTSTYKMVPQWAGAETWLWYEDTGRIKIKYWSNPPEDLNTEITGTIYNPAVSPSGERLAFARMEGGYPYAKVAICFRDQSGKYVEPKMVDLGAEATSMAWSPDNEHLVVATRSGRLFRVNVQGYIELELPYIGDRTFIPSVAWSPFVNSRLMVGTGGRMVPSAAGFIYAQDAEETKSIVAFDATTRSTAKLATDDHNTTGPIILYTVEADRLTKLSYSIDNLFRTVSLTMSATTNGAFVAFDGQTGDVASVALYSVTRQGKPAVTTAGGELILSGDLEAVYNREGKNLGATSCLTIKRDGELTLR